MNTRKSSYLRIAIISLMLASLLPVASIVAITFVPNFTAIPIAMATEEDGTGDIEFVDEDGNIVDRELEEYDNELARDAEDAVDAGYGAIEPISAELGEEAEGIEAISAELVEEADEAEATGFAWQVFIVIGALVASGALAFFIASRKKKDTDQPIS